MCLCAVCGVQAQISEGNWYNGWIIYSVSQQANGKVRMNAIAEGEEHEFVLEPVANKKDTYRVTDGPNGYTNEYYKTATVRHMKGDGLDVLCLYNSKNQLTDVISKETEWDSNEMNKNRWLGQLYGEYATEEEDEFEKTLNWTKESLSFGGIVIPYQVLTFNGLIIDTGIITIEEVQGSTNELKGTWKVVPTLLGFDLISLNTESDDLPWEWKPNGVKYEFRKTNLSSGRFDYTSHILLNDKRFEKMDKNTLRIMRNEIMARHGYRFQSDDLKKYFGEQGWYHPATDNSKVKLSFVEQLNVDLIKCVEDSK